jgi:hypothetical protein
VNHHELVGIAVGQEDQIGQIRGGLDTGHQAGQDDSCESEDPAILYAAFDKTFFLASLEGRGCSPITETSWNV